MEGSDVQAIKKAQDELMQASHKLAEMMYQQAASGAQAGGGAEDTSGKGEGGGGKGGGDEDVVDADFEEVK